MTKLLDGKLALVTGASRGIGKAVAKGFAAQGAHVIAVGRTQGALEELDDEIKALGGTVTLVPLDLSDPNNVDVLGVSVQQRFGKLDILVSNAGTFSDLSPVAHFEPHLWDQMMAVNLTANYRLIRIFDPLLRAVEAGRAIFVTAAAAEGAPAFFGPYAASKAGLEALVRSYAAEIAKSNLKVNLIDPGPTATDMRKIAYPGEDASTLPTPEDHLPTFLQLASGDCDKHGDVVRCQ